MKYQYLFGPVPSRRLGISLGVDLVPFKTCTLNCIYCECGLTTDLTLKRKEYVPFEKVIKEIKDYMDQNPPPDYITFSGSGEPLLNSRFGEVARFIKVNYPDIKLALLTNGTLLSREGILKEVSHCDVVLPSLDGPDEETFKKMNKPHGDLKFEDVKEGLLKLKKSFKGEIWLEVFLAEGINTDTETLKKFKVLLEKLSPKRIQLNTLDRPPAVEGIKPVSKEKLYEIREYFGMENVEIISKFKSRKEIKSYRKDTESAILDTIKRRPCTVVDLSHILGIHINEVNKYLDVLEKENKIDTEIRERGVFVKGTVVDKVDKRDTK